MHDNKGRKTRWNVYPMILCGLVFFVFAATIFCMAVDSSEAKREAKEERIQKEQLAKAEEQKKEAEEVKAQEEDLPMHFMPFDPPEWAAASGGKCGAAGEPSP